jgi:hypothetical protein
LEETAQMIDLNQQLVELFNKERMLAFFDFQVKFGGIEPLSGLCKISRPKGVGQQSQYLSLLFLIDTPNYAAWKHVDLFAKDIDWNGLKGELPGVETVLSIPHLNQGTGIYFKEADIYLNSSVVIVKDYVLNKLYPAVLKVTGLQGGELVFWDDVPERKEGLKGSASEKESSRSILETLKDLFGR